MMDDKRPFFNKIWIKTLLTSPERTHWQRNSTLHDGGNILARRPGFDPTAVYMGFMMGKATTKQGFLPVIRFFPC